MAKTNDKPLRFHVHINKAKEPSNNQPLLTGGLLPPDSEKERKVRLWAHYTGKEAGKLPGILSGRLSTSLSAEDQFVQHTKGEPETQYTYQMAMKGDREPMKIEPDEIVLFLAPNRDEARKQPHYFGYANPGEGKPLLSIGGWVGTDKSGDLQITGDVQIYEPRKEQSQQTGGPDRPERHARAHDPDDEHEHDGMGM